MYLNKLYKAWSFVLWLGIISFFYWYGAGCAQLPKVKADEFQRQESGVAISGVRGPISAQRSAEIVENLKRHSGAEGLLEKHILVEQAVVGRPLIAGNKITLLQDGPATYSAMFAAIQSAKDHINLETYIFDDDEIGKKFAAALLEKQSQGVQVNLIYDSVGAFGTPRAFFEELAKNGVNTLEFNPINPLATKKEWFINRRDHRKLLVVDGRVAFVGGINISGVYSRGSFSKGKAKTKTGKESPWRDTHVQIEGPGVKAFQELFFETWGLQSTAKLPPRNYFPVINSKGSNLVRAIDSKSGDELNPIYFTLVSAINSAERSICITNAYFAPDPQFIESLQDAAKRGVDVKLLLPSHTDFWAIFHAGHSHYESLLKSGVKIYERRGALLHSKTVLVDDTWSSVGSANLDWRSFVHNNELNAVILGSEFAAQMHKMFEDDLKQSNKITLEQWEKRPLTMRLQEWMARMWDYWL